MPECRFTSTALGALRLAQENAARLGHSYVGSEHLLLGLASQEYSAAARSLQSSGVDSRSLRSAISQLVGTGVPARSLHQGLTPKCCLAIQQAAAASRRLGQNTVSAEHLLLGLLQDRECAACRLMAREPQWSVYPRRIIRNRIHRNFQPYAPHASISESRRSRAIGVAVCAL